jgi:PTS system mannose-specific IIA component
MMIGIVIVTHGKFGLEILKSAELIVGKQTNVKTLSLEYGDNIDNLKEDIFKAIVELKKENEVLVFADLFAGSPANSTAINMEKLKFKCITGVNLPMIIEAFSLRNNNELSIDEIVESCLSSGMDGIKDLDKILFNN